MKITIRSIPSEFPKEIVTRLTRDISTALNAVSTQENELIVNDTLWFQITDRGLKPALVNSAAYITSRFQEALRGCGWNTEDDLNEQSLDGYIELGTRGGASIGRRNSIEVLAHFDNEYPKNELDVFYTRLYQCYVKRRCFSSEGIAEKCRNACTIHSKTATIRCALEFETGNIASSFRAFTKLGSLFQQGHIDAAIFITSIDKASSATRIWPASNRNGSYEELDNRNYRSTIFFPMLEVAFAPDGFSQTSPYLGSNGKIYMPQATGEVLEKDGVGFDVYLDERKGKKIYLPKKKQNPLF